MTLNEWCWEEQAMYRSIEDEADLYRLIKDTWNAAREDLLKEMYPLRGIMADTSNSNKEQTNENR